MQSFEIFLSQLNQPHLIKSYKQSSIEDRFKFSQQIKHLNQIYPGGLKQYCSRAKQLLRNAAQCNNPYQQYDVGIPNGVNVNFNKIQQMEQLENIGMKQFDQCVFVLVAGGLGQRLGYPGIKIAIPFQLITNQIFISYYCEYILAFQNKFCTKSIQIPLVIMTSDDTYEKTKQLLQNHQNFGMQKDQIILIKQQKVPAILDNQCHLTLVKNKLEIQTKPHGHGDIHTLLYQHKLVEKWNQQGKKWAIFFQDTNPLVFKSFTALLGVCQQKSYDFTSIGVSRKPGEAVGAITTLLHRKNGRNLTINVEYNQLQGLFKNSGGQKVNDKGYSVFPGNINSFCIKLNTYNEILNSTKGTISQFINPKYSDNSKTIFKSPARLECMMQDYPKLLNNCNNVGFIDINKIFCFTTVKNDLLTAQNKMVNHLPGQSAATCQADYYKSNREMLRICGAQIQQCQEIEIQGMKLSLFPMIHISPQFATSLTQMRKKVKKLKMSSKSSLVIHKDCILDDIQIDGHTIINQKGNIKIKNIQQNYIQIISIKNNQKPYLLIRGFNLSNDKKQ